MRAYRSDRTSDGKKLTIETKDIPFPLDGVEFTAVLRGDGDSLLEWSEMAGGAAREGNLGLQTADGAAFISRFFMEMLPPLEYLRFRQHLKDHHTHPNVLGEIMSDLSEEMQNLVEENTERPTEQPSRSSGGRTAKGGHRLKIISEEGVDISAAGDVVAASAPAVTGPTPEQRAAMEGRSIPVPGEVVEDVEMVTLGTWTPGVPLEQQITPATTTVRRQTAKRSRRAG